MTPLHSNMSGQLNILISVRGKLKHSRKSRSKTVEQSVEVGSIDLTYDALDTVVEFPVTIAYDYFVDYQANPE